jgi:serine/threonine protein phosphatase PrpC
MSPRRFRFVTGSVTHAGSRKGNEDSHTLREAKGVWAVADGMGGHENGRWASATVAEAIAGATLVGALDADGASVKGAIRGANDRIREAGAAAGKRMGSTVVALLAGEGRYACFWVGDSRGYLLRGRDLRQVTRDHTQVEMMVERGLLERESARKHPLANVLSRAVGVEEDLQVDAATGELQPGDVFLLCSDGLTGVVSDAEIAEKLDRLQPQAAADTLKDMVLARGAPDNVTIIIVACDEATTLKLSGDQ